MGITGDEGTGAVAVVGDVVQKKHLVAVLELLNNAGFQERALTVAGDGAGGGGVETFLQAGAKEVAGAVGGGDAALSSG